MTDNKKEQFLEAYHSASANISVACKKVGISRETYYRWCKEDASFKANCSDVEESLLDMAETMLLKAIRDGKTAELIFYLKTKGKSRGYVERTEMTGMNGMPMSQSMEISVVNNETKNELIKLADNL